MSSRAAAEATAVEETRSTAKHAAPAKAAAKRKAPTKAAANPRTRTAPAKRVPAVPAPSHTVLHAVAVLLVTGTLTGAALVLGLRDGEPPVPTRAATASTVSGDALASFAASHTASVYWAGDLPGRTLELTTTEAGTFVRYLPSGTPAGDSRRALTVATYRLQNAFATATRRADAAGMASTRMDGGGLAVWSKAQPRSVYLAFPDLPYLVEVYAPTAREARTIALSGRVAPVR